MKHSSLSKFGFVLAFTAFTVFAEPPQSNAEKAWSAWRTAKESAYASAPVNAASVAEAGVALKNMLQSDPATAEASRDRIAVELVDFTAALAWAKAGNFERASESLAAEASTQAALKRVFLENTRQPEAFARDVFSLHSLLLSKTPSAKNIANLGYDFFEIETANNEKAFVFVYGSDGEFQAEFATEGVEANEQKKMIYLFEPDAQGRYVVADRAQVIADRARFSVSARKNGNESHLVLGGIKKVIEYQPTSGYPDVRVSPLGQIELRVGAGKIEQPLAAIERAATPQKDQGTSVTPTKTAVTTAPSPSLPPTKAKPIEAAKPPAPSMEPTSSTPWSVVAVLIVAAIGLLWLLVKNRK